MILYLDISALVKLYVEEEGSEDVDTAVRIASRVAIRYMGDGSSFPREEAVLHERPRKGELYLDLGGKNWVSLCPFIVHMIFSHHEAGETYFIDAWNRKANTARMKSFERGHTVNSPEVSDSLAEWENTGEATS